MTSTIDAPETTELPVVAPPSPPPATSLPRRTDRALGSPQQPRAISAVSARSLFLSIGALGSAFCLTLLLFGRLASFSGKTAFVVVFALSYVLLYALLISLEDDRVAVVDRVMTVLMSMASLLAFGALSSVVIYTFIRGWNALWRRNFLTQDLGLTGPQTPLDTGGITHAIVGTLIIITIALVLTVPLAIAAAVYMNESDSRTAELVRSVVTAMIALPSIVAGLFILSFWILILGFPKSGMAAALAISLMMLPIIVRSADVVLRLVPGSLREAAAALGAPQWRVVWHVVLPTARSGLTTSVILGVARGIGETAPVLLVSGSAKNFNTNPFSNPMSSLPLTTFELVKSGVQNQVERGFATAAVLMLLVLILFTLARVFGGRPAGHLSSRQARRAARRSSRDRERIEGSHPPSPAADVTRPPELESTP